MKRETPFPTAQIDPDTGERYLPVPLRGAALLKTPVLNKGTAFSRSEREMFGLVGMLPDHVSPIEEQVDRIANQIHHKVSEMDKNIYLNGLMDRNETLFYRYLVENLEETVPLIYTPTVALSCRHWSRIYRRARGVYVTPRDRGRILEALRCRPKESNPVIVVTDNERILGIGDQGAGGMGIPIGKLALYAAAAGIHPTRCIPISLDVGTDNAELLADPLYVGYRKQRLRGEAYDDFIAEFVAAVQEAFPGALLQWEDFSNKTSFENLSRYRDSLPSFNDDIQGTAAMVVAGLMAATQHIGSKISDQRIVIVGAGSAGIGIREQIATAMVDEGSGRTEAEARIMVLDSRGLIVEGRPNLSPGKQPLALALEAVRDWQIEDHPIGLRDVVRNARASVLIGVSGVPGVFTEEMIRRMALHAERPIIMPLSNPTSHAEVTPASAIEWTDGRAIVATGSPFPSVRFNEKLHRIGQANNVFVFPGIGLGVLTVGASRISDKMFLAASKALSETVSHDLLESGQLYPSIFDVRATSAHVARAVAHQAVAEGLAPPMDDINQRIEAGMWFPDYLPYRPV
ncbi:MAG: NAD-dependent malic enzyme [Acidimicrobiia bacterium]|nr:NAD-dependent malic enzyme [Acidimicrobiia bacterium]